MAKSCFEGTMSALSVDMGIYAYENTSNFFLSNYLQMERNMVYYKRSM